MCIYWQPTRAPTAGGMSSKGPSFALAWKALPCVAPPTTGFRFKPGELAESLDPLGWLIRQIRQWRPATSPRGGRRFRAGTAAAAQTYMEG